MSRSHMLVAILVMCAACARSPSPSPSSATADDAVGGAGEPRPDSLALPSGQTVYVPADLEDALQWLDANLSPTVRQWLQDVDEIGSVAGLSRFPELSLRDRWGLASGSRLASSLGELGLEYPDAMAALLVTSFWRRLHDRPLRLADQAWRLQFEWELLAHAASRGFPACPQGAEMLPGVHSGRRWYLHPARCSETGELWAYELHRGWFRPDSMLLNQYQGGT